MGVWEEGMGATVSEMSSYYSLRADETTDRRGERGLRLDGEDEVRN